MKHSQKLIIGIGIALFLLLAIYILISSILKYGGYSVSDDKNSIEKCLRSKDITLYINTQSPPDYIRSLKLSEYLTHIKIMNCYRNNQVCDQNGIKLSPSWIINGVKYEGEISSGDLLKLSDCLK
jgi:hypothetical protein